MGKYKHIPVEEFAFDDFTELILQIEKHEHRTFTYTEALLYMAKKTRGGLDGKKEK